MDIPPQAENGPEPENSANPNQMQTRDDDDGFDPNSSDGGNSTETRRGSGDSQADVDFRDDCWKSCEPPFQDRREAAYRRKLRLRRLREERDVALRKLSICRREKRTMRRTIDELEQRLRNRGKQRKVKPSWKAELAKEIRGDSTSIGYKKIYTLSCREENCSPTYLHPLLRLRAPTGPELAAEAGIFSAETEPDEAPDTNRSGPSLFDLPVRALVQICKYVVVFREPVHVVSRLDPYHVPDASYVLASPGAEVDGEGTHVRLLHRFLIGTGPFSLTCARKPNEVLGLLLMNKQLHYIACNLFYSSNKFCFSSLGELGRFAGSIGSRLQRIQRIELFWTGSQNVSFRINKEGHYVSRRTAALGALPESIRLKELSIYLRASHPDYERRKHESHGMKRFLKRHTIDQPNFRGHRDMYTVQGMDNVRCLRGLHALQFWDYDVYLQTGEKNMCLRDYTFVIHMNDVTGKPKAVVQAHHSKFQNLASLCIAYLPTSMEREAVARAIRMRRERDDGRRSAAPSNEPDDSNDHGHGLTPGFGPGNGGGDDDNNDDDDDAGHCRPSPSKRPCLLYNDTAARPLAAVADDGQVMADPPPDGEQADDEMSDDERSDDEMSDAEQNGDEVGDGSMGAADPGGTPLRSPPAAASAPAPARSESSSLLINGATPARDPSPGQAQPSYRFTPLDGGPDEEREESSLFVADDSATPGPPHSGLPDAGIREDEEAVEAGGDVPQGPRSPQDWEKAESSDEDEDGQGGGVPLPRSRKYGAGAGRDAHSADLEDGKKEESSDDEAATEDDEDGLASGEEGGGE